MATVLSAMKNKYKHLSFWKLYSWRYNTIISPCDIQVQNVKFIFKKWFNNDELLHWAKKIKTPHAIRTKWGIRICCQARILTVFLHREGKGIILLVTKS